VTIDEARASIGKQVAYSDYGRLCYCEPEEVGEITSVNRAFAFVRFSGQRMSKACRPETLTLAAN
jgi:hypothetical protein